MFLESESQDRLDKPTPKLCACRVLQGWTECVRAGNNLPKAKLHNENLMWYEITGKESVKAVLIASRRVVCLASWWLGGCR